jgi:hypothetical protein
MTDWEPVLGAVVSVPNGDVGVVEVLDSGRSAGVRIVQEDSEWAGQLVYFNRGQLTPVNLGG